MTTIEEPTFTLLPSEGHDAEQCRVTTESFYAILKKKPEIVGRVALSMAAELVEPSLIPATRTQPEVRESISALLETGGNGHYFDYDEPTWDAITADPAWKEARQRMESSARSSDRVEENRKIVALHGLSVFAMRRAAHNQPSR